MNERRMVTGKSQTSNIGIRNSVKKKGGAEFVTQTGEKDAKEILENIHHFPQFNYEPSLYLLKITKEDEEKKCDVKKYVSTKNYVC